MKEFDWDFAEKTRSHNIFCWLKDNHTNPVNQDDFVLVMRALSKANRLAGTKKHLNSVRFARKISGYNLRKQYRALREQFGFFPGV